MVKLKVAFDIRGLFFSPIVSIVLKLKCYKNYLGRCMGTLCPEIQINYVQGRAQEHAFNSPSFLHFLEGLKIPFEKPCIICLRISSNADLLIALADTMPSAAAPFKCLSVMRTENLILLIRPRIMLCGCVIPQRCPGRSDILRYYRGWLQLSLFIIFYF